MKGKFKLTILILFYLAAFVTVAEPSEGLKKADSLFMAKKYTTAFDLYEAAYSGGQTSPAMLLKMAFIKEGLGDDTQALYYLNKYYSLTADRTVLTKMQELANENQLSGYEVEDRHFFLNALTKYHVHIQLTLAALILLLTIVIFRSKQKGELAIGIPVVQVLLLAALLTVSNRWLLPKQAIIKESTFLMSAPSAASEPIGHVKNGHLVEIIDRTDAWTQIKWEGKNVYIRHAKLKAL